MPTPSRVSLPHSSRGSTTTSGASSGRWMKEVLCWRNWPGILKNTTRINVPPSWLNVHVKPNNARTIFDVSWPADPATSERNDSSAQRHGVEASVVRSPGRGFMRRYLIAGAMAVLVLGGTAAPAGAQARESAEASAAA